MSLANPRPPIDPNRPLRPLEPGEAEKGALVAAAWQYAQQYPIGQQAAASLTYLKQHDPNFVVPTGYEINQDTGAVQVDRGSWLARNWSYIALAVVGGAAAISALPAAAASGATPGVTVAGPSTSANLAATSSIAGGSTVPSSLAAAGGGGSTGIAGDILKAVLPTAGNLVSGLIQAKASGAASDAQQKYLEEALAYQKEQDAYARTRQQGLDAQEVQRYGDYQGRIAPWIANGTSSTDRMAALLGLPTRSGSSGGSYGSSGRQGVTLSPEITARVLKNYADLGVSPTGSGTGPTDSAYFANKVAETGGLTDNNTSYWFGPSGRIASELSKAGVKGAPSTSAPSPSAPTLTTQPLARSADVQMRAPDGSIKTVPADQVEFYRQRGATPLQGAA